jgi:hypothetical protein
MGSGVPHKSTDETRAQVAALASFGIRQEDIAKFLGISHVTLRKHYDAELEVSPIKANGEVGQYLHALASGRAARDGVATPADCTRAAIFWAKTRMNWRETNNLDLSSSDGTMSPREIIIRAADGKG